MSDNHRIHRRTVLKRTGATLALTAAVGTASASERAWYVVNAGGDATARLERRGFDVANELAGGDVLVVEGDAGATDRIASTRGVASASVDVTAESGPTAPTDAATATVDADAAPADGPAPETTDEPYYGEQWDKAMIDLPAAHARTTGEGTRIAIVDSGIHAEHPDLDVNEDLSRVVTRETIEKRELRDFFGHGTHVAGIATASINNDVGIAGVAPDAEAVSIRTDYVPEAGDEEISPSLARRLVGLEYAASIDADVACTTAAPTTDAGRPISSLPPEARGSALAEAARRLVQHAVDAGTVVVQAAGNWFGEGGGANFQEGGGFMAPGFVPAGLTVGAVGPHEGRAVYSNYGLSYLDIAAPGGGYGTFPETFDPESDVDRPFPTNGILSTVKPGTDFGAAGFPEDDLYAYAVGTSMATPQAAGAAALVRSIAPAANPYRVMQAIKHGAEGGPAPEIGHGRLNVANALDAPVLDGARE